MEGACVLPVLGKLGDPAGDSSKERLVGVGEKGEHCVKPPDGFGAGAPIVAYYHLAIIPPPGNIIAAQTFAQRLAYAA